jgi:hypothetical protein
MPDPDYIPVRPNIDGPQTRQQKSPVSKQSLISSLENSTDTEVQQVLGKKKIDTRTIKNAEPTEEEKKSNELSNDPPKTPVSGNTWVILGLAIVILILIMIIIYYVLNYNAKLTTAALIPPNIVRPSENFMQKPKNYIDPTASELDSVLHKLSSAQSKQETPYPQHQQHPQQYKQQKYQIPKVTSKLSPIEEIVDETETNIASKKHVKKNVLNGHTNGHVNGNGKITNDDNDDDSDSIIMDNKMELNLREQLGIDDETPEHEDTNNNQAAIESMIYED